MAYSTAKVSSVGYPENSQPDIDQLASILRCLKLATSYDDARLSATSKKAFASLLGAQSVIQPLKHLTRRYRPDRSNRLSFPSADVGAASSLIPAVYTGYGLIPATAAAAAAAFIGFARMYGNKQHLSDVLAGYAIGLGWGLLVETSHRRHAPWTVLLLSDGRTLVGLALQVRWD